jgi:hypothetical protein
VESILDTVKKMVGVSLEDTAFDVDLIVGINSAIMALTQLGVGPAEGFIISDKEAKWADFLGATIQLEPVKMYVYLQVKMGFDPPQTSFVLDAMNRQLSELAFRINLQVEPPYVPPSTL